MISRPQKILLFQAVRDFRNPVTGRVSFYGKASVADRLALRRFTRTKQSGRLAGPTPAIQVEWPYGRPPVIQV